MPRMEDLNEYQRSRDLMFACMEHDASPFNPLRKELSQAKVALVTTAGLHLRGDKPFFDRGDPSYRIIPSNTPARDIVQSHNSIGFDHTAFYRDVNITFPVDRLHELVERSVIGCLSENFYSFAGSLWDPREQMDVTGPEVVRRLLDEDVDVVLFMPT